VTRWLAALGLAMVLGGCSTAGPAGSTSPSLAGTSWVAEDIDGRGVLGGTPSTLVFDAAQRISGRAACNQYFGTAEQPNKPARTTVQVAALVSAGALLEVEVQAARSTSTGSK